MKVVQLTLTYNRHTLLERNIASFISQDYEGEHTMVIFNTGEPTTLINLDLPDNKKIILINNQKDYITGNEYNSVGDKYRDAYTHLEGYDIIVHLDDDDFAFPNNISEGVKGMQKAYSQNKLSYKPKLSWFLYLDKVFKAENVCEGSIFVDFNFMKSIKFPSNSVKYHDCWVHPLQLDKMLVDSEGISTWIYDWGRYSPTYKMSGRGIDDELNYLASKANLKDFGDGILIPLNKNLLNKIYNNINEKES